MRKVVEITPGNSLLDCLAMLAVGAGGYHVLTRKSREQVLAKEKEPKRKREVMLAADDGMGLLSGS